MKSYKIAAIPGDGIGSEVIAAGIRALDACAARDGGFSFSFDHFDWGSDHYKKHGVMMPADGLAKLRPYDAIYFGAVGAPDVPDHVTLWGLRLAICQPFDQYVRPTRILPGITSRCGMCLGRSSTGLSSGRIRRGNMPAWVAVCIEVCRMKSPPTSRCSRATVSRASCALPSNWRGRARART